MDERVLLVSESNILQTALRSNFEKEGYVLRCCTNQPTALSNAIEWQPQVIVIDEALANGAALKIAKTFSTASISNQLPYLSIIMLAEAMEPRKLKAAYKAGVDFYILKQGADFRALILTLQTVYRQLNQSVTFNLETTRISA